MNVPGRKEKKIKHRTCSALSQGPEGFDGKTRCVGGAVPLSEEKKKKKTKKNEDRDFLNRFHGCDLREIDPVSFIWKTCPKYLQNISWVRNVTHKWSCTSSQTSRGPSVQHGILSGTILCLLTRAPKPWHTPSFIFLLNINLEIVFTRFVYFWVTRGVRHFVGQSIPRFRVDVLCNSLLFFVVAYKWCFCDADLLHNDLNKLCLTHKMVTALWITGKVMSLEISL